MPMVATGSATPMPTAPCVLVVVDDVVRVGFFGLTGLLLEIVGTAGLITLLVAIITAVPPALQQRGLRWLRRNSNSSEVMDHELEGMIANVALPIRANTVARSFSRRRRSRTDDRDPVDGSTIDPGERVVIVRVEGGVALVAPSDPISNSADPYSIDPARRDQPPVRPETTRKRDPDGYRTALAIIAVLAVLFVIMIVSSLIVICPPNKVAVISGRTHPVGWPNGRLSHSQGWPHARIPILEKVSWMDLNTIPRGLGHQRLLEGRDPAQRAGHRQRQGVEREGLLENAAERFLDRPTEQIGQIAKETLEANLRGVLATLSPEEVNEDRLKFSHQLIDEADDDIKTLGLELDVMKIQNVTDDNQYLDSVGRRLTAEVVKQARVAEAERMAESEAAEAAARERAQIATVQADKNIVEEQNQLRVRTAELEAIAKAKEEERPSPATSRVPPPSRSSSSSASSWSVAASRPMSSRPPRPTSKPSSSPLRRRPPRSSRTARPRSRCSSA